ncbi:MAG TPA: hypothetical protein VNI01_14205, partial [Elusimicrobiota bacterium]|nr:hypothetical protein [Elusimicrobiota bacterium]
MRLVAPTPRRSCRNFRSGLAAILCAALLLPSPAFAEAVVRQSGRAGASTVGLVALPALAPLAGALDAGAALIAPSGALSVDNLGAAAPASIESAPAVQNLDAAPRASAALESVSDAAPAAAGPARALGADRIPNVVAADAAQDSARAERLPPVRAALSGAAASAPRLNALDGAALKSGAGADFDGSRAQGDAAVPARTPSSARPALAPAGTRAAGDFARSSPASPASRLAAAAAPWGAAAVAAAFALAVHALGAPLLAAAGVFTTFFLAGFGPLAPEPPGDGDLDRRFLAAIDRAGVKPGEKIPDSFRQRISE